MKLFLNQIGIASIAILFATATCNNSASTENEATSTSEDMTAMEMENPAPSDSSTKIPVAALDTIAINTSKGTIKVVLYNETPLHKANFLKLCKEGYYDGLLFHRVIPNFMIQGGDPNSKTAKPGQMLGNGGPNYTIPAEFNSNLRHKRGALAAARMGDNVNPMKESSGSQFYICHGSPFELDMNYTVFGETVEGFDVIDKIANAPRDMYDRPKEDIKIISTKILTEKAEAPKADKGKSDTAKSKAKSKAPAKKKTK